MIHRKQMTSLIYLIYFQNQTTIMTNLKTFTIIRILTIRQMNEAEHYREHHLKENLHHQYTSQTTHLLHGLKTSYTTC